MPNGKAYKINLRKIERRALLNLMTTLEERANQYSKAFGKSILKEGKVRKSDEVRNIAILKLKAILLASDGKTNRCIAKEIEMSEHSVGRWRKEFFEILSRDDLPFERITGYFHYDSNALEEVIWRLENNKPITWRG
ncbi:helix-turn-helix domain-containing protein [Methylocystis parvus]|uniref:Helix-turn-helix domain-containing protein n=1 Tax=Methylocystis parvus TaxID=134 RepID=A0A6B8MB63_9HYPH|nr:helix-turn-helix domain-containing protein [Methylocystis parvus]QGM99951.1 helix-turn-helix domain-containing protein [Methylocystis parvus]WBK02178.1 helix-turn-helix domain-containing protein [Methylocystis parvus OBBP]